LRRLGLNAELRDTNEIEVDGKRIAGTGGGRIADACVVVGNLLFDFDFESMTAVWRTPSTSFRLLAEQALRQQLTTLGQLGVVASMEQVAEMLIGDFSKVFGRPLQMDSMTDEEIETANEISKELTSEEFLSLHKERENRGPMRSLKVSARAFIHAEETRMNGYDVRGSFWVSRDVIQTAKLESEPMRQWRHFEERLKGIPFKEWQEQIHVQ
jgi:lipoate-protein ligase A